MRKRIEAAIAARWARALAWLRREAYVKALVQEVAKKAFLDGHAAAMETIHPQVADARACALAYGELLGRQALAHELQVAHGVGEGGEKAMNAEEVATLATRQLH